MIRGDVHFFSSNSFSTIRNGQWLMWIAGALDCFER